MVPFISIILTTHNRANLLRRALKSLLLQSCSTFEIILCADESSRETKEIAHSLLRESDSFLSTPNLRGPAETRNIGISLAVGKWICFMDDDNTYTEDYLASISNLSMESNQIHYFNYNEITEDRENEEPLIISTTKGDLSRFSIDQLLISNFIPNNVIALPTEIAKLHPFDVYLQSHEDWDWLISLKSKGYEFNYHQEYLLNRHISEWSSKNNDAIKSKSIALDFLSVYRKWPTNSEEIKLKRADFMKRLGLNIDSNFL